MERTLVILLMMGLVFSLFPDDAKVMPKGVLRAYVVHSYRHSRKGVQRAKKAKQQDHKATIITRYKNDNKQRCSKPKGKG